MFGKAAEKNVWRKVHAGTKICFPLCLAYCAVTNMVAPGIERVGTILLAASMLACGVSWVMQRKASFAGNNGQPPGPSL